MTEKIELTKEELEEIKDEIRFRQLVYLQLKQLNGVPKKVAIIWELLKVYGGLIFILLAGLVGLGFNYFKK